MQERNTSWCALSRWVSIAAWIQLVSNSLTAIILIMFRGSEILNPGTHDLYVERMILVVCNFFNIGTSGVTMLLGYQGYSDKVYFAIFIFELLVCCLGALMSWVLQHGTKQRNPTYLKMWLVYAVGFMVATLILLIVYIPRTELFARTCLNLAFFLSSTAIVYAHLRDVQEYKRSFLLGEDNLAILDLHI